MREIKARQPRQTRYLPGLPNRKIPEGNAYCPRCSGLGRCNGGPRNARRSASRERSKLIANILEQRVRDHLAAFYSGDVDAALANCADDIDYICYAPTGVLPHLGQRRGKAETEASWRAVVNRYPRMRHEVRFIVADNNKAAVIIHVHYHKRDCDRVVQIEVADFYTFRNGHIVEIRQFFDSFDLVEQLIERDITL